MTVYVDDARIIAIVGGIKTRWSHLITDSLDIEELHQFAALIGLKRSWFQEYTKVSHLYRPHYDITDNKRLIVLQMGAESIPMRETPNILRKARESYICQNFDKQS
jgi:hypothetical protein